jgi:transposase
MEEGRLRTSPETFKRRFASEQPMRIAIEAGTHSPWASRVLEECGHEVLVANARKTRLIYANKRKTDEIDALRTWLAWLEWTPSCCTHSSTGARRARPTWPLSARVRRWLVAAPSWSITSLRSGQILRGPLTALTFVLTLEDPYRFEKSRSVGAYLGLVPASEKSGDRDPQKRIFRRKATRC